MFVYNRHKIDSLFGFLFTFFFRSVLKSYVLNTSSCMCIRICLDSFHNYCPTYVFCIGMTRTVFMSKEYLVLTLTDRVWLNNFTSSDNRGNWLVSLFLYVQVFGIKFSVLFVSMFLFRWNVFFVVFLHSFFITEDLSQCWCLFDFPQFCRLLIFYFWDHSFYILPRLVIHQLHPFLEGWIVLMQVGLTRR